MRKTLEAISLAALALQVWYVLSAAYGPNRLPDSIPIHFDMDGHANGWGSPAGLLLFTGIALTVYLLLTVIARFPATFNYPVEVTEANRPWLQALAVDMVAWIKTEMVCMFGLIQWAAIHAARRMEAPSLPLLLAPSGVVLITVAWFVVAMRRATPAQQTP